MVVGREALPASQTREMVLYQEPGKPVMTEDGTTIEALSPKRVSSVSGPKYCDESLDYARLALTRWDTLLDVISDRCDRKVVAVDSESLDAASVTAVARSSLILVPGNILS